ncbi:MAG: PEP-CTERM sorting domain-containing protein [Phycisphaerales bacterium]|nr:PEP-CTERM sorting domain-containing protein [Phycisphaerales bacterium]
MARWIAQSTRCGAFDGTHQVFRILDVIIMPHAAPQSNPASPNALGPNMGDHFPASYMIQPMRKGLPLASLMGLLFTTLVTPALAEGYNPWLPDTPMFEHGQYSGAYISDWSVLPTGKEIAAKDLSQYNFTSIKGENKKQSFINQDVYISDLAYDVRWNTTDSNKTGTTLFRIQNAGTVVIDNVAIRQMDADYRGYHTIMVEGADNVIIRNSYFAGAVDSYHIRLEGVKNVFVENVEFAGIDYFGDGESRLGGGLWVNNGKNDGEEIYTPYARLPEWTVVQNNYVHGAIGSDNTKKNQDGFLFMVPGDGVFFNNVIDTFLQNDRNDAALDVGFRRSEPEYQNHMFRVERNIIENCSLYKHPGPGSPNELLFANNVFVNARMADYHKNDDNNVTYVNNTYIFDISKAPANLRDRLDHASSGLVSLWDYSAPTDFRNNLLYVPGTKFTVILSNNEADAKKYENFTTDNNLYAFPEAGVVWVRRQLPSGSYTNEYTTMQEWRNALGNDLYSELVETGDIQFAAYVDGDYRLLENPWLNVATPEFLDPADPRMKVDRDFYGNLRSESSVLAVGAFSFQVPRTEPEPVPETVGVEYREIFANNTDSTMTMADFRWIKHNYNPNSTTTKTFAMNRSSAEDYVRTGTGSPVDALPVNSTQGAVSGNVSKGYWQEWVDTTDLNKLRNGWQMFWTEEHTIRRSTWSADKTIHEISWYVAHQFRDEHRVVLRVGDQWYVSDEVLRQSVDDLYYAGDFSQFAERLVLFFPESLWHNLLFNGTVTGNSDMLIQIGELVGVLPEGDITAFGMMYYSTGREKWDTFEISTAFLSEVIPEPATLMLLVIGACGLYRRESRH